MTILRVAATASDTLDQTSYTLLNSMIHTNPAANTYLAYATLEVQTDNAIDGEFTDFALFVNGTIVAESVRSYEEDGSIDFAFYSYTLFAAVDLDGTENVEIRYQTSVATTPLICFKRELVLFPYNGTALTASATGSTTIGSSTYADLLTLTTPTSGTYLALFGASYEGTSGGELGWIIEEGGSTIAHSERLGTQESSGATRKSPVFSACIVTPNGSEDIVGQWKEVAGADTMTVYERMLVLIPIAGSDIFQATGTADDVDATTTDKLIDGMTITNPGATDYVVLFSTSSFFGTIGNNLAEVTYSIRSGGTLVTDTERRNEHEGSLDDANLPVCAGGKITHAASDDITIFWQGESTESRTARARTVVAIREVSSPAAYDQDGFQFINDDGSESGASDLAAEDTNITRNKELNTRLRIQIDTVTADPPTEQTVLQYKEVGDPAAEWRDVPLT